MRPKKPPECLYHYTSIETLALILKNRSIRFTPLSRVDDLLEGKARDLQHIGQYVFASCWTDKAMESMAMWNFYATQRTGVRIQLPQHPFRRFCLQDGRTIFVHPDNILDDGYIYVMSFDEVKKGQDSRICYKVTYTDDVTEIIQKTKWGVSSDENSSSDEVLLWNVGYRKLEEWGFQSEWRYILRFLPVPEYGQRAFTSAERNRRYAIGVEAAEENSSLPFEWYDLTIDDAAFEQMRIRIGPSASASDEAIVTALKETYNPSAPEIEYSQYSQD